MSATIEDIARRVGTSKMTVSLALRGTGRMSTRTRDKILAAAKQLGYRPNVAARAVSTGRFGCAALVLSTRPNASTLPDNMLKGVHDTLITHDMHLTVAILPDEQLTSAGVVPKILRNWLADGLLINYTHEIPARMVELIRQYAVPSIWINSQQPSDAIYPDDFSAGRDASRRLIELGHSDIAYVDYSHNPDVMPREHYSASERLRGYEAAMREARLPARPIVRRVSSADRARAAREWLERDDRPTAVVCYGSTTAVPIAWAAVGLGIVTGRDLSIISFDGRAVQYAGPPFATMLIPEEAMGREAAELLVSKINDPNTPVPSRSVPFRFEEGATLAPPRR